MNVTTALITALLLMPPRMTSGMNRDELMDLIAYLLSGGDSRHKAYDKQ